MQLDPHAIHIRTDGSCYPKRGMISGCAAIVEYPDHLNRDREQILDFGCAESKIPRMELMAVISALRWIAENRPWPDVTRVQILTDSRYVVDNHHYASEWRSHGWRSRHGEPIKNPDLWKQFLSASSNAGMRVDIVWIPGKKTKLDKEIDQAAKSAGQRGGPCVDRGYARGAISRSMVKDTAAIRFAAKGQTAVVRIYRKDVMKRADGENQVRFNTYSEESQTFVGSCYAYATPEIAADLHRQHGYRVSFNDDPHYPRITEIIEEVSMPKAPAKP